MMKHMADEITLRKTITELEELEQENDENFIYIVGIRPSKPKFDDNNNIKYHIDMFYELSLKDLKKLEFMSSMTKDKLWPIPFDQAQKISEVIEIPPLHFMKIRARANPGTSLHIFHTKFKCEISWFEFLVNQLNSNKEKQLWKKSKIF